MLLSHDPTVFALSGGTFSIDSAHAGVIRPYQRNLNAWRWLVALLLEEQLGLRREWGRRCHVHLGEF
jgi:hypothetical protein